MDLIDTLPAHISRHADTTAGDAPTLDPDEVFAAFAGWAEGRGLTLYPAQEEALIELVSGSNVILATPTGSGKSLVAAGAQFAALAAGQRSFYTAPIKALVSEKFFDLCATFGGPNVGMMTGDAAVNPTAPVICCTAEVLANIALRQGRAADVGLVVMDEFHFYADPERGWAWQVPLLELPDAQFLLMSATLGDTSELAEDMTRRTGRSTAEVRSATRPVPLTFVYQAVPLHEILEELLATHQAPAYVVHSSQAAAIERAQTLMSINVCTREEKDAIAALIGDFRFSPGFGRTLARLVRHGIGVHHAGMLPKYRRLVERLAQGGLLKIICGTDTLGVGINVPIRTVVFTALSKYDGTRNRIVTAREFHQIAGRAGRAGFDTMGKVVVQAPEHTIENERAVAKAGDDPKKIRKIVRKKPPEGFVSWGEPTFQRLVAASPEPLTSSFAVSHSMLLNVIQRPGNAFEAMKRLLTDNHETKAVQRRLVHRAISMYRGLVQADIVERLDRPDAQGRVVRLTVDLQDDFALNQPLSPFAIAVLELLDIESPSYALDALSVIESTLDDPSKVLDAQKYKARGEAVNQMKSDGVEYEERMARLENITYPRPLRELLFEAYDFYKGTHPWVLDHPVRPKSIVRDLYERAMTFAEFVQYYGLARSEGVVLRYLSDAYKALERTIPEDAKTEDLYDLTEWLGELVRQVDSSLLDEWEQLQNPSEPQTVAVLDERPPPLTGNPRAFRVLVRNALFRRVELAAARRYHELGELDSEAGWTMERWFEALAGYFAEHSSIGIGPDARGPQFLMIDDKTDEHPGRWLVRQIFDDPAGHREWGITAEVDLAASDDQGFAAITLGEVGVL
jgi:superfamily II RNA helicase